MSLVAYDTSSDEESDNEDEDVPKAIIKGKLTVTAPSSRPQDKTVTNGRISDEDDDFEPIPVNNENTPISKFSQLLPKPKNDTNLAGVFEGFTKPTFTELPTPKVINSSEEIEEDDDEFLHKKPREEVIEKPQKNNEGKKMPVKISIPSLKNFQDVDKEIADKAKNKNALNQIKLQRSSGLLSMLPKAKSEQNFAKASLSTENAARYNGSIHPITPALVPDAVKHRRPATNTEDIDRLRPKKKKMPNQVITKTPLKTKSDSDDSADEDNNNNGSGDFFSFNIEQNLPEVSATEINALVAKKAAEIAETSKKYLYETENLKTHELEQVQKDEQEIDVLRKRNPQEQQLNHEALQALVGGSSKRRRQQKDNIQVVDINSDQVLPDKDEWMRTALASSTTYQPTGVLVDEEPASGTRRKHQITYLAHKAKANEAELQAMWSANRQNRRATQSKYGF